MVKLSHVARYILMLMLALALFFNVFEYTFFHKDFEGVMVSGVLLLIIGLLTGEKQ